MALCGDQASLTSGNLSAVEGHRFVIELGSNEQDVRTFGDGPYGSFIACAKSGTMTIDSYERPNLTTGSHVTATATVGSDDFTIPLVITSQTISVDAKDVVQYTTVGRIEDTVGIA